MPGNPLHFNFILKEKHVYLPNELNTDREQAVWSAVFAAEFQYSGKLDSAVNLADRAVQGLRAKTKDRIREINNGQGVSTQ